MKESAQITQQIAAQLKFRRKQKGWSLDKTAQATGVSKAMLGQIEREESSPTIATLWKIATGLDASFSSFISSQSTDTDMLSKQQASFTHDPNMQVTTLFKFNPVTGMETFEITLINHHEQRSSAHAPGVTEHIHVLRGELAVFHQDTWHTVKANEQFILQADAPHGYRDATGETTFIDIICYP